jgi:hypothetical protein
MRLEKKNTPPNTNAMIANTRAAFIGPSSGVPVYERQNWKMKELFNDADKAYQLWPQRPNPMFNGVSLSMAENWTKLQVNAAFQERKKAHAANMFDTRLIVALFILL